MAYGRVLRGVANAACVVHADNLFVEDAMNADEKLVRRMWVAPNWSHDPDYGWNVQDFSCGGGMALLAVQQRTRSLASAAAAEFTRKRLDEIKEIREEHELIFMKHASALKSLHRAIYARILARLAAALEELQRGMVSQRKAATEKEK